MNIDQSASVLLMSVAEAKRCGIAENKWIYLHGCADTVEKEVRSLHTHTHTQSTHMLAHEGRETKTGQGGKTARLAPCFAVRAGRVNPARFRAVYYRAIVPVAFTSFP